MSFLINIRRYVEPDVFSMELDHSCAVQPECPNFPCTIISIEQPHFHHDIQCGYYARTILKSHVILLGK